MGLSCNADVPPPSANNDPEALALARSAEDATTATVPRAADASGCGAQDETDHSQAHAKAKAVAALQRLFFQELAAGKDANGAAAIALLRLTDAAASSSPDAAD